LFNVKNDFEAISSSAAHQWYNIGEYSPGVYINQESTMPLYEYVCPDCGQEFEKRMSFSQASETPACPNCNGTNTRKKISLFSSSGSSGSSLGSSSCGSGSGGFT
jgi:putative FmdB family regulatory protein